MTKTDIEIIVQGAKEKYPEARPRIISDKLAQIAQREVHPARDAVVAR